MELPKIIETFDIHFSKFPEPTRIEANRLLLETLAKFLNEGELVQFLELYTNHIISLYPPPDDKRQILQRLS